MAGVCARGPGIEDGERNLEENRPTIATEVGTVAPAPRPSVFLSYASEDRPAVRSIRDALSAAGLEVWYDESELDGGDAWDQKIRRQIRECDYFMPVVSARTQARHEGYFRREWRLAVERTLDMADDHTFLLPVVIDDTDQTGARVPEKFLAVQWLRVPGGQPTPAFESLCRRIARGKTYAKPPGKAPEPPKPSSSRSSALSLPEFPREEPGQRIRFGFQVVGWALQCAWTGLQRLPRWVRYLVYCWIAIMLLSLCHSGHDHSEQLSKADSQKLKEIAARYRGSKDPADIAKLGTQIAREFSGAVEATTAQLPLLAIPFTAPTSDPAAAQMVDSTFAQVYGRLSASHHGEVGLSKEPVPFSDLRALVERGRANHSTYVLSGGVESGTSVPILTILIARPAEGGSIVWSKSYPLASANPEKIAAEVDDKVESLDDLD